MKSNKDLETINLTKFMPNWENIYSPEMVVIQDNNDSYFFIHSKNGTVGAYRLKNDKKNVCNHTGKLLNLKQGDLIIQMGDFSGDKGLEELTLQLLAHRELNDRPMVIKDEDGYIKLLVKHNLIYDQVKKDWCRVESVRSERDFCVHAYKINKKNEDVMALITLISSYCGDKSDIRYYNSFQYSGYNYTSFNMKTLSINEAIDLMPAINSLMSGTVVKSWPEVYQKEFIDTVRMLVKTPKVRVPHCAFIKDHYAFCDDDMYF